MCNSSIIEYSCSAVTNGRRRRRGGRPSLGKAGAAHGHATRSPCEKTRSKSNGRAADEQHQIKCCQVCADARSAVHVAFADAAHCTCRAEPNASPSPTHTICALSAGAFALVAGDLAELLPMLLLTATVGHDGSQATSNVRYGWNLLGTWRFYLFGTRSFYLYSLAECRSPNHLLESLPIPAGTRGSVV
jgi:hypothetical protein